MMDLIDIHAHLNFPQYDADREEVIRRTVAARCGVINVGTSLETSRAVVELTRHPNFWAAVGIHPHEAGAVTAADWPELERLAAAERVVAIGECGLDYFRLAGDQAAARAAQQAVFERQIALAERVGKPLMLHIRDSYDQVADTLARFPGVRAHAHFFAGGLAGARRFLELGCTLSFTGVITFSRDYDEVIRSVPLDRLLGETDAPYVAPVPYRGQRNEPLYVERVYERIAELRGLDPLEARQTLVANARRVFDLT